MSIRISRNLKNRVSFDPTKESVTMTISKICDQISQDKIVLPVFQTGLRWTEKKVIELLNFQMTGFAPVAPISMCKLDFGFDNNPELATSLGKQVRLIDRTPLSNIKGEVYSLTDGQQRTTTNYKCYIGHEDFKNIVLDLAKGKFISLESPVLLNGNQIPVTVIYNKDFSVYNSFLAKHPDMLEPKIANYINIIRNKFMGYSYTINFADGLSEKQQLKWFEILNNAGSKIPITEMNLSRLKSKDVDYYKEFIEPFMDIIESNGYESFFPTQATRTTYPLSALNPGYDYLFATELSKNRAPIPSDGKDKKLATLNSDQLHQLFNITLKALQDTMEFIADEDIQLSGRMEHITFALGFFVYHGDTMSTEKKEFLKSWINSTDFVNMSNSNKRETYQKLIMAF